MDKDATNNLPETRLISFALSGIFVAAIVWNLRELEVGHWLLYRSVTSIHHRRLLGASKGSICFVLLGCFEQGRKIGQGSEQMPDNIEQPANQGWLVEA